MDIKDLLARIDPGRQDEAIAAFRNCKNLEDAKAVTKQLELPITEEELSLVGKQFAEGGSRISEEMLGNVAGGTVGPTITEGCW